MSTEEDEHLMDVQELATFLNVPVSWVYSRTRRASQNRFPVVKAGKYCRFTKGDVMNWLRTKTSEDHE